MNRNKKLGKNIVLISIGNFGSKLLVFFLVPLYTRYLSTSEFGIAEIITTTISLLVPILTLQITPAMMRFALDKEANHKKIFMVGCAIQLVGLLIMLILSPIILLFEILRPYYLYFVLYYITFVLYNCFIDFARGIDKVKVYTVGGICQTMVLVASNVVALVFLHTSLDGYLLSFSIAYGTAAAVVFILGHMQNYVSFNKRYLDKSLCKKLLDYSVPMIPNSISWWISNSSNKYILAIFCSTSTIGLFSIAFKIPTMLSLCNSIFMSAWILSAVEGFGSEETRIFFSSTFRRLAHLLFVVAGIIIAFNDILAKILYSDDFVTAKVYVPILTLSVLFHAFAEFFGSVYTASKNTKMLFYSSFFGAIINIAFSFALIPLIDAYGAALATMSSYVVILLLRGFHSRRFLAIEIDKTNLISSISILAIMCVLHTIQFRYAFISGIVLLLILMIINRNLFNDVYSLVIRLATYEKSKSRIM